jgi:CubicO group peptidase (beta-lactamase class C family)
MGIFSGTVLIAKNEKIIINKGYGYADLELDVKNQKDTKYRIGSLTKQFTAAAVMQLADQNKLKIEDKLINYIPDYPRGDEITIKNLLNHTSGIFDYTRTQKFRNMMGQRIKLNKVIELFKGKDLNFEPGQKYQYCNSNYVLLGYIIEQVSGLSYEEYLHKNIFDPLDMHNSGYAYHHKIIKGRASGYVMNSAGNKSNIYHDDATFAHGAGALYSTTKDLYKWDRALYTNQILSDNSLKQMFTTYKGNYGFGFKIDKLFKNRRIYHHGGTMGYTASINRYVDEDITIIVLSNINGTPIEQLTKDLAAIMFEKEYYLPDLSYELKQDEFQKYAGTYKLDSGREVTIMSQRDKYFVKLKQGPAFEIIPSGQNEFFLKII